MTNSLKFRLGIGAVIAIAVSLSIIWASLSRLFTDYVMDRYVSEMTVLSDSLAAGVNFNSDEMVLKNKPSDPRLNLPGGGRYWQVVPDRGEILRSRSMWESVFKPEAMKLYQAGPFETGIGPDGEPVLVLVRKSALGEDTSARSFTIYTAFTKTELDAALTSFHSELRRMLIITALILSGAAVLQAATGLAPLDRLRRKVRDVRAGQVRSLGDDGPREVLPLVNEINLLLDEREHAISRARQRASDLAHGLKTPLTVLSQLALRLDPNSRALALEQVDLIRQRADRQLQAARLGAGQVSTTDVAALVGKLVRVLKPVTEVSQIGWTLQLEPNIDVNADTADLAEAIGNILDNACKWAASTIIVGVRRSGGDVIISVGDDGPGVPETERQNILRRGMSAGGQEPSSGLGLAIVDDIVRAYGARLAVGQSPVGGLEVSIHFPLSAARAPSLSPT